MNKKISTNGNKVLRYIAKKIAVKDANTTCPFLGYQPKLPAAVKKLKYLKWEEIQETNNYYDKFWSL